MSIFEIIRKDELDNSLNKICEEMTSTFDIEWLKGECLGCPVCCINTKVCHFDDCDIDDLEEAANLISACADEV